MNADGAGAYNKSADAAQALLQDVSSGLNLLGQNAEKGMKLSMKDIGDFLLPNQNGAEKTESKKEDV